MIIFVSNNMNIKQNDCSENIEIEKSKQEQDYSHLDNNENHKR